MIEDPLATTARELERARPFRSRARARARAGALRLLRTLPRRPSAGIRIVHYHHVFDDERERFVRHLEYFAREFEPVALSEAVARLRQGRVGGRELVITFDDGFRNQLTNAARLLAERGLRGCFFVVTELVSARPEQAVRICRERLHLPRPVEPLSWDDVGVLLELGHEVGSHTRRHVDLTILSPAELEEELAGSRADLESRLGRSVRHFSAPYGEKRRFSPAVSEAARRAGYSSCATAQRGSNVSDADVYALRRDHLAASWSPADVRYFLSRP